MKLKITAKSIKLAASIIKNGGLVAFPTETVYGLGANALDKKSVLKIFKVKGRPADNPLIVHIADKNEIYSLAKKIPQVAKKLIDKFWPGPLTLVLEKKSIVPKEVSAGGKTVAIRMPNHKIALALIRAAGMPIAAPSANISGHPSPTTAQHVAEDFEDKIDLILDGGRTSVGVESTVVDMTVFPPVVLRQGGLSLENLKKIIPEITSRVKKRTGIAKSPGMKYRHYAPRAPLILAGKNIQKFIDRQHDKKVGVLASKETASKYKGAFKIFILGSRKNPEECAWNLFTMLRRFDRFKVDIIIAEVFPEKGLFVAVMDRLRKASAGR